MPNEREWLERVELIGEINSPAMAKVHGAFIGRGPHPSGDDPGKNPASRRRYLVMEYVEGSTLTDWVIDHPAAPFGERTAILRTLAHGIDALHEGTISQYRMVHGDIKPENIRVSDEGDVKLVDFGQTVRYPSASPAYVSFPYGAPELYTGSSATVLTDRYAFAATAFYVMTGEVLPYSSTSAAHPEPKRALAILQKSALTCHRKRLIYLIMKGLEIQASARLSCREICDCQEIRSEASLGASPLKGVPSATPPFPVKEQARQDDRKAAYPPFPDWPPPVPYAPPPPLFFPTVPPSSTGAAPPAAAPPRAAPPPPPPGAPVPPLNRFRTRNIFAPPTADARYFSSLWTMSDIAAPLLAIAAITFLSVMIAGDTSSMQHDWATVALVASAGAMITSVQCGFHAKLYVSTAESVTAWSPGDDSRANTWVNRARRAYSLGIVLLWVGIATALIPNHGPTVAWVAPSIAGLLAILEIAWIMAPVLS
jgi:serine/threonine protein kinase